MRWSPASLLLVRSGGGERAGIGRPVPMQEPTLQNHVASEPGHAEQAARHQTHEFRRNTAANPCDPVLLRFTESPFELGPIGLEVLCTIVASGSRDAIRPKQPGFDGRKDSFS